MAPLPSDILPVGRRLFALTCARRSTARVNAAAVESSQSPIVRVLIMFVCCSLPLPSRRDTRCACDPIADITQLVPRRSGPIRIRIRPRPRTSDPDPCPKASVRSGFMSTRIMSDVILDIAVGCDRCRTRTRNRDLVHRCLDGGMDLGQAGHESGQISRFSDFHKLLHRPVVLLTTGRTTNQVSNKNQPLGWLLLSFDRTFCSTVGDI